MNRKPNRRELLETTALAGAGLLLGSAARGAPSRSPNEKLGVAVIGVGGRGRANLDGVGKTEEIVALCDVDQAHAGNAFDKYPRAKRYTDYRRMFDELHASIDAVIVNTPDHTHFHPAYAGLQLGKHLYCEKPMAHNVWEVRTLTELAREKGLATQLGVQRHTIGNVHRTVELIQAGTIGEVTECYAWISGDRGMPARPTAFPEVPAHLDWDLWLGPTASRRYSPDYCPYHWRFWWDWGAGETGNWGCHVLDIPFWALGFGSPKRVWASGPEVDPARTSKGMDTHFEFPARGDHPAVTLHWSHSKEGLPIVREHGLDHGSPGVLFVGTKGMLYSGFSKRKLLPESDFADLEAPPRSIPDSPGFYREWIDACKGGAAATCHFDYSGPLTETVLLGNVAYRGGKGFDWNAAKLEASSARAQALIREEYREGWKI